MPFKEVSLILAYTKYSYNNNPHERFQILISFDPNIEFSGPLFC